MRALGPEELLAAWERGTGASTQRRAVVLLAAAGAGTVSECERLALGERDALLLELRARTLGSPLSVLSTCPDCGAEAEAELGLEELQGLGRAPDARASPSGMPRAASLLGLSGFELEYRRLDSLDLEAIERCPDVHSARALLASRCIKLARDGEGHSVPTEELPAEVVDGLSRHLAADDPRADLELALRCPQCARDWVAPLDVAAFVWAELQACALRLLREVHELARAHGWREADVLALTPLRRAAYLECVRA